MIMGRQNYENVINYLIDTGVQYDVMGIVLPHLDIMLSEYPMWC